jgi:hypothetical protein
MIRTLLLPLVHLVGMWWAIKHTLLKVPEETHVWGLALNDPTRAREPIAHICIEKPMSLFKHEYVEEYTHHAEGNG